jgi:threonine/homoserine/homoserine lactone efflux protein
MNIFETHELMTFMLVVLVLQLMPGPAMVLTFARTVSGGLRVGFITGVGIAVGDIFHTLMAGVGLSAILVTSSTAFEIIKYLGVAYLLYLGISAFRKQSSGMQTVATPSIATVAAFRQAILTEILNPKTALFFLSFLPQFVHPERHAVTFQLLILGIIFVGLSIIVTSSLTLCISVFAKRMKQRQGITRWQNKIVGSIYFALGLKLAFQQQ